MYPWLKKSLFGFALLFVWAYWAFAVDVRPVPSPESGDDGWRWTVNGWENSREWQQPPRSYPTAIDVRTIVVAREDATPRYDMHPAALGLCQLGLVLMAFTFFPPRVVE